MQINNVLHLLFQNLMLIMQKWRNKPKRILYFLEFYILKVLDIGWRIRSSIAPIIDTYQFVFQLF